MDDKSRDQYSGHPSSSIHNSYIVECGIYGAKGTEQGDPNFESSSKVNAAVGKEYAWTVFLKTGMPQNHHPVQIPITPAHSPI